MHEKKPRQQPRKNAISPFKYIVSILAWRCRNKIPALKVHNRLSITTAHSKRITRRSRDIESVLLSLTRRDGILRLIVKSLSIIVVNVPQSVTLAYTPNIDPLRESLYLMSWVQEATVQQERYINRALQQEILLSEMKLNYDLWKRIIAC